MKPHDNKQTELAAKMIIVLFFSHFPHAFFLMIIVFLVYFRDTDRVNGVKWHKHGTSILMESQQRAKDGIKQRDRNFSKIDENEEKNLLWRSHLDRIPTEIL